MVNRRIIDQAEATSLSSDDYLIADNVNLGTRKIQFTRLLSGATPLPPDYIVGFKIQKSTNTTFSTASGNARSSDNLRNMQLATSLIKDISATFDLGNNAGCMPSGLTLQANTKYYVFLISTSGGTSDIIVDTDINCSNGLADNVVLLNNFDKFVCLGYILTNSSSQIRLIYYKTAGVLMETWSNKTYPFMFYQLYADGLCIQGARSTANYNNYVANLPIPFKSSDYIVVDTMFRTSNYDGNLNVHTLTTTGFTFYTQNRDNFFIAVGYVF